MVLLCGVKHHGIRYPKKATTRSRRIHMRIEQSISNAWAYELKSSCTQAVIAELQKMREGMLSGDSGLQNIWEEICAQVQEEQSVDWQAYEDVIETFVQTEVEQLCRNRQLAIWAQTDEGWSWVYDHFSDDDGESAAPFEVASVVRLVMDDVLSAAADYESKALGRYLSRYDDEAEDDEDEDEDDEDEDEDEDEGR
jgi:hypothetical protein